MNIEWRGFGSQLTNFDVLTYDGLADPACCEKYLKDNKHNSLNNKLFGFKNMLGYLSLDIICSLKLTVFLELRSRKTVCFSEQIMSADKYPSIFSRQMKAIVYL